MRVPVWSCVVMALAPAVFPAPPPELAVVPRDGGQGVEIRCGETALLATPDEGLWSIATEWQDQWPAQWRHGHASRAEQAGQWTVLHGVVETPRGAWRVRDSYRPRHGLIQCIRRFEWTGDKTAERVTLSARFQAPGTGTGVLMPGIQYHGNPSGAKSGRTPVYRGAPGEAAVYEEHRFPMPFASFEWHGGGGFRAAALHTLPSPAPYGNIDDQWWSLGVIAREDAAELALLSGPCASNGKRGVVKASQGGFVPLKDMYLNVPPGAIIEKTFYLQVVPETTEGSGFRPAVAQSLKLFPPVVDPKLPSFEEIIQAKWRFAQTRWYSDQNVAGFHKYPDRPCFVLGWCGQAAAPGYALQALRAGLDGGKPLEKAQRSLDFLAGAEFYEGGFHTWYDHAKHEWSRHEPLSQGQGMLNFANAIRLAEETGLDATRWRRFLQRALDFHSARILAEDWNPRSTDEAFFIAPLCAGASLRNNGRYRGAAVKAGETYAARSVSMREPYWGGTLDASCEDKEGAFAALQGFLALYELTGEQQFLDWAAHALDVTLTYTVLWNIDLPPGRLRDHAFKTAGWTAVSVQNQHIDVYGVLIAPYVYRMGQLLEREELEDLAVLMYRSCGQLLDPYGSQGEQPQHTNYAQRGEVRSAQGHRGGYVEDWTVFWITAHFLNGAALFKDWGASLFETP